MTDSANLPLCGSFHMVPAAYGAEFVIEAHSRVFGNIMRCAAGYRGTLLGFAHPALCIEGSLELVAEALLRILVENFGEDGRTDVAADWNLFWRIRAETLAPVVLAEAA